MAADWGKRDECLMFYEHLREIPLENKKTTKWKKTYRLNKTHTEHDDEPANGSHIFLHIMFYYYFFFIYWVSCCLNWSYVLYSMGSMEYKYNSKSTHARVVCTMRIHLQCLVGCRWVQNGKNNNGSNSNSKNVIFYPHIQSVVDFQLKENDTERQWTAMGRKEITKQNMVYNRRKKNFYHRDNKL